MQTAIKYLTSYTTKIIILSYIFNEVPFMRVLAINDISCTGKCSLTVALPILSACGAACDIMPTALLSTHTGGFEGYTFLDLSQEMQKIADHWESLGLKFDLIYSGYLGNRSQIEFVKKIKKRFLKENGTFVVDPVLGDKAARADALPGGLVLGDEVTAVRVLPQDLDLLQVRRVDGLHGFVDEVLPGVRAVPDADGEHGVRRGEAPQAEPFGLDGFDLHINFLLIFYIKSIKQ